MSETPHDPSIGEIMQAIADPVVSLLTAILATLEKIEVNTRPKK